MKKITFTLGIILLMTTISICQNDNYEFLRQRPSGEGLTTFFDVIGLEDEFVAELIISDLRQDQNIWRADYFKLKNGKDRIHIFYDKSIDANYVHAIIKSHDVDYDLSTVLLNGELHRSEDDKMRLSKYTSTQTPVNKTGFPQYENTGNKEQDDNIYRVKKDEWISNNPEEYNNMIEEMQSNTQNVKEEEK
ncbi:MAG: hypothetical protein JXR36_13165 [Bacteroidales bacterium]|nr:hypothetical protein [Bacteroidales bacterium]